VLVAFSTTLLVDNINMAKSRIRALADRDELTSLYNMRAFARLAEQEHDNASRTDRAYSILMVDIEHLKIVNDTYGHEAGSRAVNLVAEALVRLTRSTDVVARYGGDEFLVVLPSTHFAGSVTVAERIWREAADTPVETEGSVNFFTVSIGVALYPSRDVRTKDALLRAAESALNQAKRDGGNRICVFQQQGYIYTPSVGGGAEAGKVPLPEPSRPPRSERSAALAAATDNPPASVRPRTEQEGRKPT